jgi:hypothetical protein
MPVTPQQSAWMAQWRAAQDALREQRARELRAMTDRSALAAAEALLAVEFLTGTAESGRTSSGLVRQQALFHRRPRP